MVSLFVFLCDFHQLNDGKARFLAETLSTLSAWYKNEKLYEAEAIGNFKPSEEGGPAQNLRPGFVQRGGALANLANATRSDFLSHLDFKKAFIKWQRNICIVSKTKSSMTIQSLGLIVFCLKVLAQLH